MKQSTFARKVLKAVVANGYKLHIIDDFESQTKDATVTEVMDFLKSVDQLDISCTKPDCQASFLSFIWQGNDESYSEGEEILSDHGVSLSSIIDPLYAEVN